MKVQIEYFKASGKFYSDATYQTEKKSLYEIFEEIRKMQAAGKLPGLVEGAREFYIHAACPDHPNDFPRLFLPVTE